jgi:threonine synthase
MSSEAKLFSLACSHCDWRGEDADINRCPQCGSILTVAYADSAIEVRPDQPGLWRYGAHLPLRDTANAVSLGEGNTPLLRSSHVAIEPNRLL